MAKKKSVKKPVKKVSFKRSSPKKNLKKAVKKVVKKKVPKKSAKKVSKGRTLSREKNISILPVMPIVEFTEIVVSFDTTGSMYTCLTQVRSKVSELVTTLFDTIPNLRMGIISHGDYCDRSEVLRKLPLTTNQKEIQEFIKKAPATSGGDADECYEYVLNQAADMKWTSSSKKGLILIGDANPHGHIYYKTPYNKSDYSPFTKPLDWRAEAQKLIESGINIYPIHALPNAASKAFYETLARISGTVRIELPQFSHIHVALQLLMHHSNSTAENFVKNYCLENENIHTPIGRMFDVVLGRTPTNPPITSFDGEYQVLDVPYDIDIRDFVKENGLTFKKGDGFYQFTKSVKIQNYKEVFAQCVKTGKTYRGGEARQKLGIPNRTCQTYPKNEGYIGFIQSTSVNRKLLGGTKFLYKIART